jgi:peptide/nickel transport system substrate-binding protein
MLGFRLNPAGILVLLVMALALVAVACGGDDETTPATAAPATSAPAATAVPSGPEPTPTTAPSGATYRTTPTPTGAMPTAVPSPTDAPAVTRGQPKVDTLFMAVDPAAGETNYPWAGTVDHHQQMDLVMEVLVDIDAFTGLVLPELAKSWDLSADGKAWTFQLQEGVQWHNNWGDFTAADVLHSIAQYQRDDSLLAFASDFRQVDLDTSEIIGDHEVILRLINPNPDFLFYAAPSGGGLIMSKAQWDAGGDEAYDDDMIGTGPYRYTGRTLGVNVTYELLPDHWRRNNPPPDFQKVDLRWMQEVASRNAGLLSGELHMTELTRELSDAAVSGRGMKIIQSNLPAYSIYAVFQGLYPAEPGNFDPPYAHPDLPYTDVKIREAINRAFDKETIKNTLFSGRATPAVNGGFFINQAGWNPDWVTNFEENYGYDPERSRELLVEAGYPDGVKIKGFNMAFFGFAEYSDLLQAMQLDLQKVGIEMELEEWQFNNYIGAIREKKPEGNGIWIIPASPLLVYAKLSLHNRSDGFIHTFETAELDAVFAELRQTVDLDERDRLQREMGNIIYDGYGYIPFFETYIEWTVDPNIVDQWPFPGNDGANYGHFDLITACVTPEPCFN